MREDLCAVYHLNSHINQRKECKGIIRSDKGNVQKSEWKISRACRGKMLSSSVLEDSFMDAVDSQGAVSTAYVLHLWLHILDAEPQ